VERIGFIGLGVMGKSMAGHILAAGHPLVVYTRTREKAEELLARGAVWAESPAALARSCQVVITIVGFPEEVEQVVLGDDGVVASMQPGTILVDMTTSRPDLAVRISEAAAERGGQALDAPVSGGDRGAREAALSIMVGGSRDAYEQVLPILQLMGQRIVYQGPAGSGQHCKMCNQIAVAGNMLGVCEALAYACHTGLDPQVVLESISAGAAGSWAMTHLVPRMLAGDFAPGFFVKHFIKDMAMAADAAADLGLDLPGLQLVLCRYRQLAELGYEDDGTQALYRLYQAEGQEIPWRADRSVRPEDPQ